jgi:hypothetical protein
MDNFFSYISKPVAKEEIDVWISSNNICYLKMDLFHDFVRGLVNLVYDTYLGNEDGVKINIDSNDDLRHFDWCWKKTIENFRKENIMFEPDGDHYTFIKGFVMETFYNQTVNEVKMSLNKFFDEIFDFGSMFTASDLDLLSTLYKSLDKNLINNLQHKG